MIIILGLIIVVAALVVAVAGVAGNGGTAHAVSHLSVLGYHVTGSAGTLFLSGIVVGAAGLLGLSLLLAGARRRHRRGSAATRRLRQSRRETAAASQERDDLIEQRDTALASATSNPATSTAIRGPQPSESNDRWSTVRDLRRRLAHGQTAPSDSPASRPAPDVRASAPEPSMAAIPASSDVPTSATTSGASVTAISPVLEMPATASAPAD
jgi:hypothetical protein